MGSLRNIVRKFDWRWRDVPETYQGQMRQQLRTISFATGGMLSVGNIDAIAYALKNISSKAAILEIGAFCGLSSNLITFLKADFGLDNPFFSCDPWDYTSNRDGEFFSENLDIRWDDFERFLFDSYKQRVGFFSKNYLPHTFRDFSENLFENWAVNNTVEDIFGREVELGGPLSFVYIDGDHSYDGARRDFENTDKYLEKGGFILFDDSGDGGNWEPNRVARHAIKNGAYNLISKNPNYLIQKI